LFISSRFRARRDIDIFFRDNPRKPSGQNPQGGNEYPSCPYEIRKVSRVPVPPHQGWIKLVLCRGVSLMDTFEKGLVTLFSPYEGERLFSFQRAVV